ncbi:type II toxin-antitoxin system RelE/ParE family toxin [Patescibacteria group bacterium]|nr:type II toxin-antitoxin system RelE/ParE family toxin [Patescibacteria group bacterium]
MKGFKVSALKRVDKQLNRIHPIDKIKVLSFLEKLPRSSFPKGVNITKITGSKNTYRTRIGKIRVIYTVYAEKREVIITKVSYRKNAYRN